MSGGPHSEEVAEDYKASLGELVSNDKYTINNLTVIAKENTAYADVISKVLEEHIRKAPPAYKLPALYVLDSIAKNIGTPYTLFLGHNLYQTFMQAYALVDHHVRKKLDEMLKTWKNPVPGSIDTRPVFPAEVTKGIEKALIQARTQALQQQQQQQRSQHELLRRRPVSTAPTGYRDTSTPPQNVVNYPPPTSQGYVQSSSNGQYSVQSPYQPPYNQFVPPQPTPPPLYQQLVQQQLSVAYTNQVQQAPDVGPLHRDIETLILTTRDQFARNPYDETIQTRLKALLDLQSVLKTQHVPPHMLKAARDQISQLQNSPLPLPPATTPLPVTLPAPPPVQVSYQAQPNLLSLPSATSLADLLASVARNKQPAHPPPSNGAVLHPNPQLPISQTPNHQKATPATAENPLIASLRAAGILPAAGSTPVNGSVVPTTLSRAYPPPTINTPPVQLANLTQPPQSGSRNNVELTSASLKISRPYLISKLYEARPNQCSTCGRRFFLTEEGRTRKARHLDWHFRTNQRLADSVKRGQSRSWYVDELEWIKSRDNEESIEVTANGGKDAKSLATAAAVKNDPKTKFIPVPSDNALASLPCPICQEKFTPSWNDEAQDFVWMDAQQIGSKVYHASCYVDLKTDGVNTPRTSTPDSVLGKRKAEAANNNLSPAKIKKELIT